MSERVILAYSGGLDTSVAISWIGKETGSEVVAVAIDLGQGGEDMEVVRQRALDCGAVDAVVVDARDEFAEQYCLPAIQSAGYLISVEKRIMVRETLSSKQQIQNEESEDETQMSEAWLEKSSFRTQRSGFRA